MVRKANEITTVLAHQGGRDPCRQHKRNMQVLPQLNFLVTQSLTLAGFNIEVLANVTGFA